MHSAVYDEVLEKAIELTKDLTIGNTVNNTFMGPVINKNNSIKLKYIEIGSKEGKIEIGGEVDDSTGYFIHPTIISGLTSSDQ